MAQVINFPVMLFAGLYTMYTMIGWTFIAGAIVIVLMTYVNFFIGKLYNK